MAKATPQEYAAARILTGEWLASLTYAIDSMRAKASALTSFATSEKLALVTAYVVTKPRPENRLPSPLTVAQEIGGALGALGRSAELAGGALLGMAQWCGFIDITDGQRRTGWQAAKEIRLSIPAEAQRAQIEAKLAASDIPAARPLLECPPLTVSITQNYDDTDPAPQPIGFAVAEALAPIQSTAWRVNRFMLDTLRKLQAAGSLPVREVAAVEQAARYVDAPEFFYRCNFDWRGRIYQQGGRLQYTSGTDAARSLLEFAHGKPLTSNGHTFLGIHVATCYGKETAERPDGYSVASFLDRMVWTVNHTPEILKAVADPVGSTWWQGADEPYRFLAACRAWADIEADPHAPIYLPVTADGTASAFQHYAWLLRDEELGARVNLGPSELIDTPRDFYGEAAGGDPARRKELKAQAWMFYGKTPAKGAKGAEERAAQAILKARAPRAWKLYLALRRAAKREAQAGRPLVWTLPDGFTVRQANRIDWTRKAEVYLHTWKVVKGKRKQVARRLQARRRELKDALDINAQARGLPANLIHSLDACLLRSVVREASGVTAWAVAHDSIGLHPNYGGELRKAIIEAVDCVYGPDLLAGIEVLTCGRVEHPTELPADMRGGWYTFS